MPTKYEDELGPGGYPRPVLPRLSVAERDRRWARTRALMDRDGLDVILALNNSAYWDQCNGYGRYLSTIGGNAAGISVVFPREGEVTAFAGPTPGIAYWLMFQDWVHDVRPVFFNSYLQLVERIKELGLERGRIGIAGLSGVARLGSIVSAGSLQILGSELADAELVNATELLDEVRVVKSDEEIELLRQAVQFAEGAIEVLEREAKPGVTESVVYGRMTAELIEHGSEPNSLLLWSVGNPLPPAVTTLPSMRPLGSDDIIQVEVDGKCAGYLGHNATTVFVGEPDDTDRAMAAVQHEATRRCWDAFRPGRALGDFVAICEEAAAGTGFRCQPIIHSRGTGVDGPVLVFRARDERTENWVLEENSVFVVKPRVVSADGARTFMWGDSVVATAEGARRLGTRAAPAQRWAD